MVTFYRKLSSDITEAIEDPDAYNIPSNAIAFGERDIGFISDEASITGYLCATSDYSHMYNTGWQDVNQTLNQLSSSVRSTINSKASQILIDFNGVPLSTVFGSAITSSTDAMYVRNVLLTKMPSVSQLSGQFCLPNALLWGNTSHPALFTSNLRINLSSTPTCSYDRDKIVYTESNGVYLNGSTQSATTNLNSYIKLLAYKY